MKISEKIRSVVRNPALRNAYAKWALGKLPVGDFSVLHIDGRIALGEWLSFSEYWAYWQAIAKTEPERILIRDCLRAAGPGAVAFDVGANIGAFTCILAAMGAHRVHAFEPIPETFCRLKVNVERNGILGRCRLNCFALGSGSGVHPFQIDPRTSTTNRLVSPKQGTLHGASEAIQNVASISLDAYCEAERIERIDFLKVDVEGMEPYVLHGAREMLRAKRIGVVLIEVCPMNLRSVGLSTESFCSEVTSARYAIHELSSNGRIGRKLGLSEIRHFVSNNVVLKPDGVGE